MHDGACRPLNPFLWADDEPDRSMFITGGVHEDSTGGTEEDRHLANRLLGDWEPNRVAMYDDGTHGDATADDGLWTVMLPLPRTDPPLQLGYKYTWGVPRHPWTGTEEWPGNRRLLDLTDVDGDGRVIRMDRFADEASNKDRANSACRFPLDFTTDCNEDGCVDATECPVDLDGDCVPDGLPPVAETPLPACEG